MPKVSRKLLSIDTETTGVDHYHGARPFFVTTCTENGEQSWWEWAVNPLTRCVDISPGDVAEIQEMLDGADEVVGQHLKFDFTALRFAGLKRFPWHKIQDTLIAGHLLASNQPHNLTGMVMQYLGKDIQPLEKAVEAAVKEQRRVVQQAKLKVRRGKASDDPLAYWAIGESWGEDYWLPKAMDADSTVLRDYANTDSASTLALWLVQEAELKRRGLWAIYREKLKQVEVLCEMRRGVTVLVPVLKHMQVEYTADCERAADRCTAIAAKHSYELELPKGSAVNKSLKTFLFDTLGLPILERTPTGAPSFDKEVVEEYKKTLEGEQLEFVKVLSGKRKRAKSLEFLQAYESHGLRNGVPDILVLYPNLNPTATATTRFSCEHPNLQQVGKQETVCEHCEGDGCKACNGTGEDLHSARKVFGPAPSREWWKMDAENIELRIPTYASGQKELIDLFERPEEPPFYGSQHLLNFSVVYPDIWDKELLAVGLEKVGPHCKKKYNSSLYTSCKNGGFAKQYRAGQETTDRAFRRVGSFDRLNSKLDKLEAFNRKCVAHAEKYGYVETLPDKTVDPRRGYPLLCTRSEYGKILPTIPLDYVSQGTAGWWMVKAMNRCHVQLKEWRRKDKFDGWMILTVHDELLFDFPFRPNRGNLRRAQVLRELMQQGGDDIGVPTPVSLEYCPRNWAEGEVV